MLVNALLQVGGPAAAVLTLVISYRLFLAGAQKTNAMALKSAREQLGRLGEDVERLRRTNDERQTELNRLQTTLSRADWAALQLEAKVAWLQTELTHQAADLAAERMRTAGYQDLASEILARNAQLERSGDRAVGGSPTPEPR